MTWERLSLLYNSDLALNGMIVLNVIRTTTYRVNRLMLYRYYIHISQS